MKSKLVVLGIGVVVGLVVAWPAAGQDVLPPQSAGQTERKEPEAEAPATEETKEKSPSKKASKQAE